jgi:hypothetical protein
MVELLKRKEGNGLRDRDREEGGGTRREWLKKRVINALNIEHCWECLIMRMQSINDLKSHAYIFIYAESNSIKAVSFLVIQYKKDGKMTRLQG